MGFDTDEIQHRQESEFTASDIPQLEDLFSAGNEDAPKTSFNSKRAKNLDFSKIPNLLPRIYSLLQMNDPLNLSNSFYHAYLDWRLEPRGRFFDQLDFGKEPQLKKDGKKKTSRELFAERWKQPETWQSFQLVIDTRHFITEVIIQGDNPFVGQMDNNKDYSLTLIIFLHTLPRSVIPRLIPELKFLAIVHDFVGVLMDRAAVVPQVICNKEGRVSIRWIPALFDPTVRELYNELCSLYPPHLLVYNGSAISPQEAVLEIFFLIASGYVAEKYLLEDLRRRKEEDNFLKILLFKKGLAGSFDKQDKDGKEFLLSLHHWLYPLSLQVDLAEIVIAVTTTKDCACKISLVVSTHGHEGQLSIKEFLRTSDQSAKLYITQLMKQVLTIVPQFKKTIETDDCSFTIQFKGVVPFFNHELNFLKRQGVKVLFSADIHVLKNPSLSLRLKANEHFKHERASFLRLQKMVDLKWEIGDETKKIDVDAFKNAGALFVRTADGWVFFNHFDSIMMSSVIERETPKTFSSLDIVQAALLGSWKDMPVDCDKEIKELMNLLKCYDPVPVPKNLKATLRPYQERGFQWLVQNIETGFGSILADDMGLGKTIQVIAAILHCKNKGYLKKERVLVIAPAGLLSNWKHELERFAPGLSVGIYHGQKRELVTDIHDVMITSYGVVRQDRENFEKTHWFMCVIDEAQNIKNPRTQQTLSVKNIHASHKIALTGTPVENRLLEYWSIFDFANEGYLGTAQQFSTAYVYYIEGSRDEKYLKRFQTITNPFMLRRLKSDKSIINDLPDKIENTSYCSLTKQQKVLYTKLVEGSLDTIDESDGIKRKGLILKLITALKQVCNHPAQYEKETRTQKKIRIDQSGKMQLLEDFVENIYEAGEKVLIFTQYTQMGDIMVSLLEERFKTKVPFLYGGLTPKARDTMVRDFQENPKTQILLVSLRAGGTGLNLTAANHVIHYDLWWNPAVEAQATDRAHRIGQSRNVMVHRLLTTGTFEERIDEMIQSKKELANLTVGSGESWITEMSTKQLKDLLRLRQVE